ncbi:MAG: pyruvate dehydrogenase [Deltaproteobacteria bacterium]|nr:pyruvate dehydrogenase [Deltaproteobacteria bacterium]
MIEGRPQHKTSTKLGGDMLATVSDQKNIQADRSSFLLEIQRRVLWLSVQLVHYANKVRENPDGSMVGGHQTSSASVVTILTSLYFEYMRVGDKVSIKPHASPLFHAIQFLLGNLNSEYLKTLRAYHGLQAYPSRTKDPDRVDFSTGPVGLGAIAPNFAALVDAYIKTHSFSHSSRRRRYISLVGDAELDEGSVWEAIAEPAMSDLENVLWIVDLNRQSLDRVIPGIRVRSWREMFAANGWRVIDIKYGKRLKAAFEEPNGELLRNCIDELSNDAYQRLLRLPPSELREWLPRKSRFPEDLRRFINRWNDEELQDLFWNLGGHDFGELREGLAKVDQKPGPAVVFAYTLKGWMLPSVGHPQNHSVILSDDQMEELRKKLDINEAQVWSGFDPESPGGRLCAEVRERLKDPIERKTEPFPFTIPKSLGISHRGLRSTQQTFGTILTALAREKPEIAERVVTISPDVASSTNLGGWINKLEVWRQTDREALPEEKEPSILKWKESPQGQHIELGISENNLFMALGQFGLSHEMVGETLFPIGTLYDPFVRRGLDAFFYSLYSGGKFIAVGTPSGVTLSTEGGAHQSLITQSIGAELPELSAYEPCFGQELEWIMMDALEQIRLRKRSTYLRLSTKNVDQKLLEVPTDPEARERLRQQVLMGAYRLVDRSKETDYEPGVNVVHLFACGAFVPEAVEAGRLLQEEDILVNVINVTGPEPLYRAFQDSVHSAMMDEAAPPSFLEEIITPRERKVPVVSIVDGHPHTLAWIGSALGTRVLPLGVVGFGQSGSRADIYREHQIDVPSIMAACRRAVGS